MVQKAMWVGSIMIIGGLASLRWGWRRQAVDAAGCAAALMVACWQHPRLAPYVRIMWPASSQSLASDAAARQIALVYLFVALYGLSHVLISVYVPDGKKVGNRRWVSGVIGAVQAGVLSIVSLTILPHV